MSLPVHTAYTYPTFLGSSSLSRGSETRQGFKPSICSHVFPWHRCSSNYIIEDCPVCSAHVCRGHSSYQTLQNISGFFRLSFSLPSFLLWLTLMESWCLRTLLGKPAQARELTSKEQSYLMAKTVRCVGLWNEFSGVGCLRQAWKGRIQGNVNETLGLRKSSIIWSLICSGRNHVCRGAGHCLCGATWLSLQLTAGTDELNHFVSRCDTAASDNELFILTWLAMCLCEIPSVLALPSLGEKRKHLLELFGISVIFPSWETIIQWKGENL